MSKVLLMEFDKESRRFNYLKEVELASVPTIYDKIIIDIDGIGYVFRVYDVHYAENKKIDINVIRLSTISEFYASQFPDINLKKMSNP